MKNLVFLFAFALGILSGCDTSTVSSSPQSGASIIAAANQQRHAIMTKTRAAAYLLYPDTPDPAIMQDPGFLDLAKTDFPMLGTAFGLNDKGLIFTSAHEITDTGYCAGKPKGPGMLGVEALERQQKKKDTYCVLITQTYKKAYRGKVIHIDEKNDVAIIQLEGQHSGLPFIELAESVQEGEEVLTVGAARGNPNFTTTGIISNTDFEDKENSPGRKDIQFFAIIHPGNSGGPLVSVASGKVVGLVQRIFMIPVITADQQTGRPTGTAVVPTGASFAIHVDVLRRVYEDMKSSPR